MGERVSKAQRAGGLAACCALLLGSLAYWMFLYFPYLGADFSYWVPMVYEAHVALHEHGVLDYEFSPMRCLGLPSFSNPESLVLSVFHLAALFTPALAAIYLGLAFVLLYAFVGTWQLLLRLGLPDRGALLLALGWCLQGWAATRIMAGMLPFLHLLLAPFLLWVLLDPRARPARILAAAFWLAHMLYSGAFYSLVLIAGGIALSLLVLRYVLPTSFCPPAPRALLRNTLLLGLASSLMVLPKVLGVLNFMERFPREYSLASVSFPKALWYGFSSLALPWPYDVREFMGWPYVNWESYPFLFPGLLIALAVVLVRRRAALPVARIASAFAGLVVLGAVLSSGLLRELFDALPLLRSLHVNPRWNAIALLPVLVMSAFVLLRSDLLSHPRSSAALATLAALFVATPFAFAGRVYEPVQYRYPAGIDEPTQRLTFCYEVIFGYHLEEFPRPWREVDWLRDELMDPRCLLGHAGCAPGQGFDRPADAEALARYRLRETYPPLRWTKPPALLLYLAGFACALGLVGSVLRGSMGEGRDAGRAPEAGCGPPRRGIS